MVLLKIVAVIPAYNEEKRIRDVLVKTKKHVNKIIVIDDGSKDKTSDVARKTGAKVIRYSINRGVGHATKIGLIEALKTRSDMIIFLDADGQHDPKYIPQFIGAIKKGADYVVGCRDLSNYPMDRKIGNWGLTFLTNLICNTGISDTESGYRALTYDAAKKVTLKAERYGREMDFSFSAWKNKFKIAQVMVAVPTYYPKFAIFRGFKNFFYLLGRRLGI